MNAETRRVSIATSALIINAWPMYGVKTLPEGY